MPPHRGPWCRGWYDAICLPPPHQTVGSVLGRLGQGPCTGVNKGPLSVVRNCGRTKRTSVGRNWPDTNCFYPLQSPQTHPWGLLYIRLPQAIKIPFPLRAGSTAGGKPRAGVRDRTPRHGQASSKRQSQSLTGFQMLCADSCKSEMN